MGFVIVGTLLEFLEGKRRAEDVHELCGECADLLAPIMAALADA